MIVGPRQHCDELLDRWTRKTPAVRYDQRLYVLDRAQPEADDLEVQQATLALAAQIGPLSAAMEREDLGRGPLDESVHEAVVRDRITEGRTWVAFDGGEIVFLINVGTRHAFGCQVGGTYVPPGHRRKGYATRGMRAIGRALLQRHPRITLHVNEANTPAVRCYERAGFRRAAPFRLVIMEVS